MSGWTQEEDLILRENYPYGWKHVYDLLDGNKSKKSIQKRATVKGVVNYQLERWSEEEKQILVDNYRNGKKALCELLPNRTYPSIIRKCGSLNLVLKTPYKWDEQDKELLRQLWPNATKEEIHEAFPTVKHHAIQEVARKLGITREVEFRKGDLSKLLDDSNETYYWMGYIFADGWISKTGQIVLWNAESDKAQMEKFAKYVNSKVFTYPPSKSPLRGFENAQNMCRVAVQDYKIGQKIKDKYNYPERKTYNPPDLSFLDTKEKFLSFFAGFVDGDGSIFYTNRCITLSIECHKSWETCFNYFKDNLKKYLELSDINISIFYQEKHNSVKIRFSSKQLLYRLAEEISKLCLPLLERKWDKILIGVSS